MVGEYDVPYISYVTGRNKEPGKSFLRITQSGPYLTDNFTDMNRLGRILLAYTYQEFAK